MNSKKQIVASLMQTNKLIFIFLIVINISCKTKPVTYKVEVAKHFNNAQATIIQCSDQYYNQTATYNQYRQYSAETAEFYALKYNIPIHVFENKVEKGLQSFVEMGRGGVSMYYPSCTKEYDSLYLKQITNDLQKVYGKQPTTLAYGCGKSHYSSLLPKAILGGRNSSRGTPNGLKSGTPICTFYGNQSGESGNYPVNTSSFIKNRLSASRAWDLKHTDNLTDEEVLSFLETEVKRTINNNGFYIDFMHWHIDEFKGINAQEFIPKLFKSFSNAVDNNYISKVDYNQAIEYFWGKQAIKNVEMNEFENHFTLTVQLKELNPDIDYTLIQTPMSFVVKNSDKYQTYTNINFYGGQNVHSIVTIEGNIVFNVFLDFNNTTNTIKIDKQTVSKLKELNYTLKSNKNTIESTQPIKVTFFEQIKGDEAHKIRILSRSLKYDTKHTINTSLLKENCNYFAGTINELGESKLIEMTNY